MSSSPLTLALPAALLTVLVGAAVGQAPGHSSAGRPATIPQESPSKAQPTVLALANPPLLATTLIGLAIVDAADKPLAKVRDLVFDPAGQVVVIAERPEGRFVGIPLELLPPRPPTPGNAMIGDPPAEPAPINALRLSADPQRLASAAVIARQAVKSLDAAALEAVRRHWDGQLPASSGSEAAATHDDELPPLCLEQARGQDVKNRSGDELGEFKDVAIDIPSARVAYVVVSSGGVMGMGATARGVPLGAVGRARDGGFLLDIDRKTLDQSPGIDLDRLPPRPSLQISARDPPADGSIAHRTPR